MRVDYEFDDKVIHHSYSSHFLPCSGDEVEVNDASYKVKSRIFSLDDKVVTIILER